MMLFIFTNTYIRRFFTIFFLVCTFASRGVNASNPATEEIIKRIDTAKKELQELEQKIGEESRQLSKRLNDTQRELNSLREKASVAQRQKDEQLLSLESIKNRLEKWETQSLYQKHLARKFLENSMLQSIPSSEQGSLNTNIERVLKQSIKSLENQLHPNWQQKTVINTNGKIFQPTVLTVGPAEVYYDPKTEAAQALSRDINNQLTAVDILSPSHQDQIKNLHDQGQGYIVFDPTLGSALKLRQSHTTVVEHVSKGGVWAIPIIFFGAISLIFAIIKAWHLWHLPTVDPHLIDKIHRDTSNNYAPSAKGIKTKNTSTTKGVNPAQEELIKIAKSYPVSSHRDELLLAFLLEYKHHLDRFLGVIATSASVAPLLGLLGTVSGMISTFKLMTIFGSGDASTVSGGISEALVTTELGLIVAIPSLVVSALLVRRSKSYNHKLESFAIKLSKLNFD